MERLFCIGKKGFCDNIDKCGSCDFVDGSGSVDERTLSALLTALFGRDHDLDRLKQLLDACKGLEPNEIEESKFLIATQKDPEKMARLRELSLAYSLIGEQVYEPNNRGFISTYKVIGFYASECSILVKWILLDGVSTNSNGFEISALGEKVFVIREAAESALKAMKEREDDDRP